MKHQLTERSNDLWKEIIEQINIYEGKLVIEKAIQVILCSIMLNKFNLKGIGA